MSGRSFAFVLGVGVWTAVTLSGGIFMIFNNPLLDAITTQPLRRVGSLVGAPSLLPYLSRLDNFFRHYAKFSSFRLSFFVIETCFPTSVKLSTPAQPRISRLDDRLGTAVYSQLANNRRNLVANRFRAEHQPFGDGAVGQAGGNQGKNLSFARCQLGEWLSIIAAPALEVANQFFGDGGAKDGFAVGHGADGTERFVAVRAFE